jgi:hypothetical protein
MVLTVDMTSTCCHGTGTQERAAAAAAAAAVIVSAIVASAAASTGEAVSAPVARAVPVATLEAALQAVG